MTAFTETVRLCKGFMRLRHQFPNKQGRSKLRRWTNMFFMLRQLEYDRIADVRGVKVADKQADKWRSEALKDLETYSILAKGSEDQRREFINRVLKGDH